MSCCPKDSLGPLNGGDVKPGGTKVDTGKVSYYVAKDSTKKDSTVVVIMYPDVWGWDTGRIRVLADHFSDTLGCTVVVPKLQPPLEGGTDGDALPPTFEISPDSRPKFMSWIKTNGTETFSKRNTALISDLKKKGFKTFFAVGFCWGGWASCRCAVAFPDLLSGILIYHPSIQLEGVFGNDPVELVSKVKCSVALHICANDDVKLYDTKTGSVVQALNKAGRLHSATAYPDMLHGFMTRGDSSKSKVRRDIGKGIERGLAFLRSAM